MDSLITAAAHALAGGNPLGALKRVALRGDPPALALRGIAMAQLGDFVAAKRLLRKAIRAFAPSEFMARARCIVAEAEVALASRELVGTQETLAAARATLEKHGDWLNAAHARYLEARHLVLIGRLDQAESMLAYFNAKSLPPTLRTIYELAVAEIQIRRLNIKLTRSALARAEHAARKANIPALMAEINNALLVFEKPAGRLIAKGRDRLISLEEIEALLASDMLIADACRNTVRHKNIIVSLARRPVLFALTRVLAEAWPSEAPRDTLLARGFDARFVDESHRQRLRVEIARLRKILSPIAHIRATKRGFILLPTRTREVAVLAQPFEDEHGDLLALVADGEAWSSSALAIALGKSQRSIQRSLEALATSGKVQSFGKARARRWMMSSVPGFAPSPLLAAPSFID